MNGGVQRERETQNLKQALGSALSAQSLTWGSNPQTARSWPELKSDAQLTEPPRRPSSFYLNSSYLTYNVTSVPSVQYSDSTLPYNTWCSSPQVRSLIPIAYLTHLLTHLPNGNHRLFPIIKSLFLGLPLSLYFPLCSFVLFLKLHVWVKSYSICLSLTYFT